MKAPGFRWLIASLLFLACGLSFFDRQVLSVLSPTIAADLHMDTVAYSWVVFAFILSYSIMFSAGGWLIDRLGTRRGLALSVGLWSFASLLHAVAQNTFQLGLCRFLLGVGEGGCFPGAAKGVMEWFPKRERALAMGFATSGGSAIGAVIAPPAIVWTVARAGWRGSFVLTGVMGAAWLLFWLITYSTPERSRFASEAERKLVLESETGGLHGGAPVPWRSLLRMREVQGLVISRFFFDPVFYFYMFWIPQYLSQVRGASLERIGQLTWIPFLTLGISSVFGGWVSDRLVRAGVSVGRARKHILLVSALLTPVSMLAVFVYRIETAIALMSVLMFAHGFWITNYMTVIGDLFPPRAVATVVGLTGTAGGIGGFLTSLAIGRVVQSVSYTPVFIAAGLMYPICVVILFAALRNVCAPKIIY
jgi:MFS transporter, ACS family, hexuronate transporter